MQIEPAMRRKQKALVIKIAAVAFTLLLVFHFDWFGLRKSDAGLKENHYPKKETKSKKSIIRQLEKPQDDEWPCSIPQLKHTVTLASSSETDCRRVQPDRDSCKTAYEKFTNAGKVNDNVCRDGSDIDDYCTVEVRADGQPLVACSGHCKGVWQLGLIDSGTGEPDWTKYKTNLELQTAILSAIQWNEEGYCLLYCENQGSFPVDLDGYLDFWEKYNPQILNFPPTRNKVHGIKERNSSRVNFNLIFIDSVSRHHFYRSLSKTVRALDKINSGQSSKKDFVLEYPLFQAVKSRTFETLQVLFSGSINPYTKPFGVHDMPSVKLDVDSMFGKLLRNDYHTLWLEDLCPYWEWGLSKDLLVFNEALDKVKIWKKFKHKLANSSIKSVGNTFAGCRILSRNGVPDPFHGPATLCYRGQHHHEYQFDYLKKYQTAMQAYNENYFSFLETNIGHEDDGLRIKYLDSTLAEYVEFAKRLRHTITVIFSDHGNAYGSYVSNTKEGRLETFHPFMFIIIPEDVASSSLFSKSELDALIINQRRLISVLDFHYTITYIISKMLKEKEQGEVSVFNKQFNVTAMGLCRPISEHRTCSLIPRIMPNLCICAGYDVYSENRDFDFIIAQYFVGLINKEIQRQRASARGKDGTVSRDTPMGGFGSCDRLKVKAIQNIQTNKVNDTSSLLKMDLYVSSKSQSQNEIFFVTFILNNKDQSISASAFERVTPYSIYTKCADKGVDANLCVCDLSASDSSSMNSKALNADSAKADWFESVKKKRLALAEEIISDLTYEEMDLSTSTLRIHSENCLYLVRESNQAGVTYSGINLCTSVVEVNISFHTENLLLSDKGAIPLHFNPSDILQIISGVVIDLKKEWICDVKMVTESH